MKAVGIKVLKDNLSKYLRYVREGETVYVTDRDTVIAEIHQPSVAQAGRVSRWEAYLNDQQRRGRVRRAQDSAGASLASLGRLPAPRAAVDLQALLDDLRAD